MQLGDGAINQLAARLGPEFRLNPQMSFETVTGTYRYVFSLAKLPFKIELFLLGDDAYDQARFERRQRVSMLDRESWVTSAEDVIITKAHRMRKKDREDISQVIRVQKSQLDWPYIEKWADMHGTRDRIDQIRRDIAAGLT